jgi:cytochrome c oxidase subunit 2
VHIHKYEKLWLGTALLLIVGFIATVTYGAVGAGIAMVDDSGGNVDSTDLANSSEFSDPGVTKVGDDEYDVHVVARQFVFNPGSSAYGPITVPANSTVNFHVTSADVIHGFSIVGTNANTMVIPGEVAEITIDVSEPGEYGIVCHEYCGQGHHDMAGTLQVVPQDQYNGSAQ